MVKLEGIDNKTTVGFEDITSSPEFYTNVHAKLFDDTQYEYDGIEFNKLVNSTSIDWKGAYMPYTAKYLNVDSIYLRNTSELLDIIERIALKINTNKKVSNITIEEVTNTYSQSNQSVIHVKVSVTGNVVFSIPSGTSIISSSTGAIETNTYYLDQDQEYEFKIINNTTSDIDEQDGIITGNLTPDDEDYSSSSTSINVAIPGISIMAFYWNDTTSKSIEIGDTITWPTVHLEKSDGNNEDLEIDGTNIILSGFNSASTGTYTVYAKYNNISTSNYIEVEVKDTKNEITGIVIIGETSITIEDESSPVTSTYTVWTHNTYGTLLSNVTDTATLTTLGDTAHILSGNTITYSEEGSITINAIYKLNGNTFTKQIVVTISQTNKYWFGITTNVSDDYITASNYNINQYPNEIKLVSSIDTTSTTKITITSGTYLYVVVPAEYTITATGLGSGWNINLYTHDGTKFVRNTEATVSDGTYRIYRSATLLYGDVEVKINSTE